jgi:phosphoribosylaminoimidazole-succinocarboxamide synthase
MGIDWNLLRAQCSATLDRTELGGTARRIEGKVRDSYLLGRRRALVVSDRVSAFDVVLGTIPFKGQVLNQLAAFWFEKTRAVAPNHLLAVPDPCVSVVRECRVLPVEFVFRAYLTGVSKTSIWTTYERGERLYCGHRLPDGLCKHERFPEPLLTPTTKAEQGGHDELTSRAELIAQGAISAELYDRAAELGGRLFAAGTQWAASRGLILVDTKYEMGLTDEGELVLVDEVHTPDSSRYWYAHSYESALARGQDPQSLDKEYVRRWLVEQGYRGDGAPPPLPDDVRCEAARRYIETYELLTARSFEPVPGDPLPRIRASLAGFLRGE